MIILTEAEVRVIGSLIEKEKTTPEYYPMTINSLMNACNQKSNREPVVQYDERLIDEVLELLREKKFVRMVTGGEMRVPKYRQNFTEALNFTPQETAVMTVLMLRGAQTIGEIKGRSGRIFEFKDLAEVDSTLSGLIRREEGSLAVKLPRQPGRDSRYMHLLCGEPAMEEMNTDQGKSDDKITKLEAEIILLKSEMEELKVKFEEFRKQFE